MKPLYFEKSKTIWTKNNTPLVTKKTLHNTYVEKSFFLSFSANLRLQNQNWSSCDSLRRTSFWVKLCAWPIIHLFHVWLQRTECTMSIKSHLLIMPFIHFYWKTLLEYVMLFFSIFYILLYARVPKVLWELSWVELKMLKRVWCMKYIIEKTVIAKQTFGKK